MTFTDLFYKHIMFRHSCGVCHYTNLQRPSDITLADFWGWKNNVPDMNGDDKGISLVLINTEKGANILNAVRSSLDIREVDINNCLQPNLQHPSLIHPNRMDFEETYQKKGFLKAMKKYDDFSLMNRIKRRLKRIFKL